MKTIWWALFFCAVLTATNFGYQAATGANWMSAAERSWFQTHAILVYWFLIKKEFK